MKYRCPNCLEYRGVKVLAIACLPGEKDPDHGFVECVLCGKQYLNSKDIITHKIDPDMVRCNSGHETPRALWDCPVCVDILKEEHAKLKSTLKGWIKRPSLSLDPITKTEIRKLLGEPK